MFKRIITTVLIFATVLGFCGCGIKNVPLTDKELGMVAEYAADALLRHDKNYSEMLLDSKALTPTPTPSPRPGATASPTPTPTKAPGAVTQAPTEGPTVVITPTETPTPTPFPENTEFTNEKFAEIIGAKGNLKATYIGTSEPIPTFSMSDAYTALSEIPGYSYIIVRFQIENTGTKTEFINCVERDLNCVLMMTGTVKGYFTRKPEATLFVNDLRFIGASGTSMQGFGEAIDPGKAIDAILVFRVENELYVESAAVSITNSEEESVIIKIGEIKWE